MNFYPLLSGVKSADVASFIDGVLR